MDRPVIEAGQDLLHYRLIEKIGEGGMGVVWKAMDTTLNREVAIKVLPGAVAADPERLSRFEREARLLATLNHPNIAAIYGLHDASTSTGSVRFLAMELVSGNDLESRLVRGALPLDDVLDTARQVAEALEAAHEQGVIHRDLKPANIQMGLDGKVKVLDFGLAKALDVGPASGSVDSALSPTLTSAGTMAGMILGTAGYMSPEQARGKPVDRRSDLWSFGCVLYEMLTGTQAFAGETITDILSAVISGEPDRERLPANVPPSLHRLLDRCLAKDARRRLSDASDARLDIEDAAREVKQPAAAVERVATASRGSWLPWGIAVAALLVALTVWIFGSPAGRQAGTGAPAVVAIEGLTDRKGPEFMPALSPDGRSLAYVALEGDDLDIFLQRVGGENAINLTADHDGADIAPDFSPDGESIAFASAREGGGLFVMGATGESPRRVADEETHPDWSPDGKKLVATTEQVDNPYSRTTRSRVFVVDLASGEIRDLPVGEDGVGPRWSPDGSRIAYWNEIDGQRDLWTLAVDGGDPVRVTEDVHTDWEPMWAEDGHALYFHSDRGGSADLWRIPVDPRTGAPTGSPTPLTIGVTPVWESSISADGTRLAGTMRQKAGAVVAYDFDPQRQRVAGAPRTILEVGAALTQPDLSSDGRMLVYRTTRPREVVTTLDLETGVRRRLTDDGFRNRGPGWSADGEWISIYSNREGPYQTWLMRPDGTELHRIVEESSSDPEWSPQGLRLAAVIDTTTRWSTTVILVPDPDATSTPAPWIEQRRIDNFKVGRWSPDQRFLLGLGNTESDATLVIYDLESSELIVDRNAPQGSDFYAAWLSDSERVVMWSSPLNGMLIWNTRTGESNRLPDVAGPGDVLISPDDRTLYVVEQRVDGEVWMLTLDNGSNESR